jgi:DinB superfamily
MMNLNRERWNQGHQKLHRALATNNHLMAVEIFLTQHAMVHSKKMSKSGLWSFEDEVLNDMTGEEFRCIPPGVEHSIAWILFHIARIEDITMNMLVAGSVQLFVCDEWMKKLNVNTVHSANSMDDRSLATLSAQIDMDALRAYRLSVGRRTRDIVRNLKAEELKQKASEIRLQKVMDEGALLPEAIGILNYWSKRTIAGLLLMPPTRHNFLHLNEALRIKQRLARVRAQ